LTSKGYSQIQETVRDLHESCSLFSDVYPGCCCRNSGTCYGSGRFEVSVAAAAAAVVTRLVHPRCCSADLGLAIVAAAVAEGAAGTVAVVTGTTEAGGLDAGSRCCSWGLGIAAGLDTRPGNLGSLQGFSLDADMRGSVEEVAHIGREKVASIRLIRWTFGCFESQYSGVSVPRSADATSSLQLLRADSEHTIWIASTDSAIDLASGRALHGRSGSYFLARVLHIGTA